MYRPNDARALSFGVTANDTASRGDSVVFALMLERSSRRPVSIRARVPARHVSITHAPARVEFSRESRASGRPAPPLTASRWPPADCDRRDQQLEVSPEPVQFTAGVKRVRAERPGEFLPRGHIADLEPPRKHHVRLGSRRLERRVRPLRESGVEVAIKAKIGERPRVARDCRRMTARANRRVEAHPREIVSRVIVNLHALVIFGAVVVDGGRLPASQPEERQFPPRRLAPTPLSPGGRQTAETWNR